MTPHDLHRQLESIDPEQRRRAASALATEGGPEAIPLLILALGDMDWRVRKEAAQVTASLTPSGALLTSLVEAFGCSENIGLRNAAVEALAGLGQPAISRLSEALVAFDEDARKLAAETLGRTGQASAVNLLLGLAQDPDVNVRVAAIESLAQVGSTCVDQVAPTLGYALLAESELVRLAALDAINALSIVVAWEDLASALEHPMLQPAALTAAGRISDVRAIARLVAALHRGTKLAQRAALLALARGITFFAELLPLIRSELSGLPSAVRDSIVALIRSSEPELRRAALLVAGAIGDEACLTVVLDAAREDDLAGTVARALELLGARVGPALLRKTGSSNPEERALALRLLSELVDVLDPDLILGVLVECLASNDEALLGAALEIAQKVSDDRCLNSLVERLAALPESLQMAGAAALRAMARRHVEQAHAVVDLSCPDGPDTLTSVLLLGALAGTSVAANQRDIDFLVSALAHDAPKVRCAALSALSEQRAVIAVEVVVFALSDEDPDVRLAAIRALGRLRGRSGEATGVERLLDLLQLSDSPTVVAEAAKTLGDTEDPRAIKALRPLVRQGAASVAVAAVDSIARIDDPRRVDALLEGLSHPDPEVVKAVLGALAGIRDVRVEAHLGSCLDHDAWDVRRLAADLLARTESEVAASLLKARLSSETEPLVRDALERALGEIDAPRTTRRSTPVPGLGGLGGR